jgi:predicted  nucleic acid-binding Zn-ribbon protein
MPERGSFILFRSRTYFDAEIEKLDHWAEDRLTSLKTKLEEIDNQIREIKKDARLALNLPAKLELQRKLRQMEGRRTEAWKEFDQAYREVEQQKEMLLDEIGKRLK